MGNYRRRARPPGLLFLTWHLSRSLPLRRFPKPGKPFAGRSFFWIDEYLDCTGKGPRWLADAEAAAAVSATILNAAGDLYDLHAFAVLPNHAHLLIDLHAPLARLLHAVKRESAHRANLVLHRAGKPFWECDTYDHWVDGAGEIEWVRDYIENDPVRAGLVARPECYRWSSAFTGTRSALLRAG